MEKNYYLSPFLKVETIQLEGGIANQSTETNPGDKNGNIYVDDYENDGGQTGTIDWPF